MSRRRPPPPRLDPGTKIYYKRIESVLEGEAEGGEGAIYLKNVVDQVITDGARLVSCDKDGSKALELLLRHYTVNSHSLKKLMKAVKEDFFKLCVNRCGSHVMQALVHMAGRALSGYHTEVGKDDELMELFMEFVSVFQEKLPDCIRHPYASHVLGGMLQVLGGVKLAEKLGRSRYSLEFRTAKMTSVEQVTVPKLTPVVPESFCKSLDKIAKKISKLSDLEELLTHQNASPVIQCLLSVLATRLPDRAHKLTKKIVKLSRVLEQSDGDGMRLSLPEMFTDVVGSHLMETMLKLAPPNQQELIFERCLKGKVLMTALHPVANFPLRQFIGSATPDLLVQLVAELGALEEVFFVGHTGLVVKLVEASIACPDIQHSVFTSIMKAFHTEDHPRASAPVILALLTYELFYEHDGKGRNGEVDEVTSHPWTLHGSLLLQALLKFQDPRTVVRSLLVQDAEELARVGCDSSGSHVLTAFLTSHTVPTKKKEKMMKKLLSKLVPLCVDKHGSRVVDVLWKVSDMERKQELVKILQAHEEELTADFHGSIVLRNCNITYFTSKQEGWLEEDQKMAGKRKKLFQEIFDVDCRSRRGEGSRKKLKLKHVADDTSADMIA